MNKHSTKLYTVKVYHLNKIITNSVKNSWNDNYTDIDTFHTGCFELKNTYYFKNKADLIKELRNVYPTKKSVFFYTHLNHAAKINNAYSVDSILIVSTPLMGDEETLSFTLKPEQKKVNFKQKRKSKHYTYYCDCWHCQKANGGRFRNNNLPNEYFS